MPLASSPSAVRDHQTERQYISVDTNVSRSLPPIHSFLSFDPSEAHMSSLGDSYRGSASGIPELARHGVALHSLNGGGGGVGGSLMNPRGIPRLPSPSGMAIPDGVLKKLVS
jgi:hypothetical protein